MTCPRQHSQQVKRTGIFSLVISISGPRLPISQLPWQSELTKPHQSHQTNEPSPAFCPSSPGQDIPLSSLSNQILVSLEEVSPLDKGRDSPQLHVSQIFLNTKNNHPHKTSSQASLIANIMVSQKLLLRKKEGGWATK